MTLYEIYDDGDGHRFLVPRDEMETVENLAQIGDSDTLYDILDSYQRLEGQKFFVVLEDDV